MSIHNQKKDISKSEIWISTSIPRCESNKNYNGCILYNIMASVVQFRVNDATVPFGKIINGPYKFTITNQKLKCQGSYSGGFIIPVKPLWLTSGAPARFSPDMLTSPLIILSITCAITGAGMWWLYSVCTKSTCSFVIVDHHWPAMIWVPEFCWSCVLLVESKWYRNDRHTLGTSIGGSSGITEPLDDKAGC